MKEFRNKSQTNKCLKFCELNLFYFLIIMTLLINLKCLFDYNFDSNDSIYTNHDNNI